jgi:hypothetical protein
MTFIKASCSHMQQTMPQMTQSKLAKRSFDSFAIFKDPDYITGIQGLGTLQPLHNTQVAYWAVKEEACKLCKWTAKESDFDKGSVLFNHKHRFSSNAVETMHAFVKPKIQILHASNILVVDDSILDRNGKSMNIIVGDLSMPEVSEAFYADAEQGKQPGAIRKYSTRTKYLVNILTKDNKPAHEVPLVLTLKGIASKKLSEDLRDFYKSMDRCMSVALQKDASSKFDKRVTSLYIFSPTLDIESVEVRGGNKVFLPTVVSFERPDYSDLQTAQESMLALTVSDDMREKTWSQIQDEDLGDYINKHSQTEAAKLGGAYAQKEGLILAPAGEGVKDVTVIGERDDDTGEVANF